MASKQSQQATRNLKEVEEERKKDRESKENAEAWEKKEAPVFLV